ncbi:nucleoside triphosphate pyrophosphohydrolase [Paenibacillus periandrae]|uniref:nucleoside triphosphate pyrophosphohydrolase n=1 Tax=Paenibacillus periandrae TaxID=1761741 RepID=UPI001F08DD8F|nr:nucleoside triphosphate pyrophosphohydrolase [Paenibacillus periandrae]
MKTYNKLIRDKIPQVMDTNGVTYIIIKLNDQEYVEKLNEKLQEELDEYIASESKEQVEELADLVELIYAILENKGVSIEEFENIRLKKKEERGGFEEKLLLLSTE